ncbi:MAG: hypothetical protein GWN62_17520 [Aliifodinibius sp.]|nr:hypothetical protein [Fodinibius sp.]
MHKRKYVVGISIIVVAIAFLVFQGFNDSMMAYVDVRQIREAERISPTGTMQVAGTVKPGSIQWIPEKQQTKFILQDLKQPEVVVSVVYTGIIPDNFKPGRHVVVQGQYSGETEVINSRHLLVKCPSKYEASQESTSY